MNRFSFLPPVPLAALQGSRVEGPATEVTCYLDTWRNEYHLPEGFLRSVKAYVEVGRKKRQLLLVTAETIGLRMKEDGKVSGVPVWYAVDQNRRSLLIFPTPIEPMRLWFLFTETGMHGWLPKERK